MDVGVFGQQDDAEGVSIQPVDWMDGAALTGSLIVPQNQVCQRAGVAVKRGMDHHPSGLVQGDEALVLV